jgi:thiol reductant ABC exporter CydC subunit
MSAARQMLRLQAPSPGRTALAAALGALAVVLGACLLGTAGYLISRAAEQPPILSLTVAIVAVRAFGIARPIARYCERLVSHDLALRGLSRLRVAVYRRLEPLAPGGLGSDRQGDLMSRAVADVDAQQNLVLRGLLPPAVALAAGATIVIGMAFILPVAALALAIGLVLAGSLGPAAAWTATRVSGRRRAAARGALSADLVELLRGSPELVAFGAGEAALARLRGRDAALRRIDRRDAAAAGAGETLAVVVAGATALAVLLLAASAARAGAIDRVEIAALVLLAIAAFEATQPLAPALRTIPATLGAGRRVAALVERRPVVRDPARPQAAPTVPALAMEHVRFRHGPAGPWLLDGVDLELPPGRRVALVGASGAGKTTIAHLLVRFLDPIAGRVTLGGADLRELAQVDVRRMVTLAEQDAHLFSTSILENVRLARPDADERAIESALRRAQLWPWVSSLPGGWHTLVGEDGAQLSGGQRQRVSLARALLADAPVLVLDEPTAHLDGEAAAAFVGDALRAAGDRSVLLITHRPEGIELVDEVLTLEGGRLRRGAPPAYSA